MSRRDGFYCSAEWMKCREAYLGWRIERDGALYSDISGVMLVDDIVVHHKIEVGEIPLESDFDFDNFMLLTSHEHNQLHQHAGGGITVYCCSAETAAEREDWLMSGGVIRVDKAKLVEEYGQIVGVEVFKCLSRLACNRVGEKDYCIVGVTECLTEVKYEGEWLT